MGATLLFLGAFGASAVEMVEATTIVLAVALTYSKRIALAGTAAALLALAVVVGALGPSLVRYVPIHVLQIVVGVLLLMFGLQWLRKAILRAAGLKAMHDESAIFDKEVASLKQQNLDPQSARSIGFTVAFKGVFLEGLEVAFIVLTFGASSGGRWGFTAGAAAAAVVVVAAVAVALHKPLSRVPENHIKFGVGLLLTSFGTFWTGEGLGVTWKLGDATILLLLVVYIAVAWVSVQLVKAWAESISNNAGGGLQFPDLNVPILTPVAKFWYDFIVGDSVSLAIGGVLVLALTAVLVHTHATAAAQLLAPIAVVGTLGVSLRRA